MLGAATPHERSPQAIELPADIEGAAAELIAPAQHEGVAVGRMPERLSAARFLQLATKIGTPCRETSPDVARFVEADYVLNLVTVEPAAAPPSLQPFSPDPLTLHSESSAAAPHRQPRFICLMCVHPGDSRTAQTIVVSMADVYRELPVSTCRILEHTSYAHEHAAPILRWRAGRPVFSFRDFGRESLAWKSESGARPDDVNSALRQLLLAMYVQRPLAVTWQPCSIVLIDNQRVFHGRTRGTSHPHDWAVRHLRRIRLLEER